MKLFDKLKNIFIEEEFEEYDDIPKNKEKTLETTDIKENISIKEEKNTEPINETESDAQISDRALVDTKSDFKFPIIFEEDDFKEEKKKNKSVNVLERETNKSTPEIKKEVKSPKKVFKPSPVISPVYGVLDKNYSKEDVKSKDGLLNDSEEKIDIDYVINKAYRSKAEEIDELNQKTEDIEESIDLFKETREYSIEEQSTEEIDDKIKSIDELLKDTNDDDFYSLVDSMYKNEEEGDVEE